MGGGGVPGLLGILVPWVLSLMVSVLLAGRKLSLVRLSISVAVSQFLFHVLFVLGSITPVGSLGGHVHGAPMVLPPGTTVADAVIADSSMWFGHAAALIVTVAMLHSGERTLLALRDLAVQAVRWVRLHVDTVLLFPLLPVSRRVAIDVLDARPLSLLILRTLQGRAPPRSHAF